MRYELELLNMSVVVSPAANLIVIEGNGRGIEVYNSETEKQDRIFPIGASALAFSPQQRLLACGQLDGTTQVLDPTTGAKKWTLDGSTGRISALAYSPDGHALASVSSWDMDTTSAGSRYSEARTVGTLSIRDAQTGAKQWSVKGGYSATSVLVFAPDGQTLAAKYGETVFLYDVKTGRIRRKLAAFFSDEGDIAFSPSGNLVAGGSMQNAAVVCATESGEVKCRLPVRTGTIWSVAFSPDGKLIAIAGSDNTIQVCDAETGELKQTLTGLELLDQTKLTTKGAHTVLRGVSFSGDGRQVIAVGIGYLPALAPYKMAIQRWRITK
jgi:WD40 repeat protein